MSIKIDSPKLYPILPKLPNELVLHIFSFLDLKDCLIAQKVCRHWRTLVHDSSTVYGRYLEEVNMIKRLSCLPPIFSAWESMPRHWGIYTKEHVLNFSSIDGDVISFHPPFCHQSSKFFSFTLQMSQMTDRYIYLAHMGNTYFLTPQGQTRLILELPSDLQPLASHTLLAVNIHDPTKNRQFSLLRDLPSDTDNLSGCQIKGCIPISETNIVVITTREISFWNLSETPHCYKEIQIEPNSKICKLGTHILIKNKMVDLRNPVLTEHGFDFQNDELTTFSSTLCAFNKHRGEIRYFALNNKGVLENKWNFNMVYLLEDLDQNNNPVLTFYVTDMNDKFILLTSWQSRTINLFILNTKGELVHTITQEIQDDELEHFSLYKYPIFAHLSDNILTYKNPQNNLIYFWHLPTKKCIQNFEWMKLIYDIPLNSGSGLVQDVRLTKRKLTILLSSCHTPLSNKPGKYRLVQFDPALTKQPGLWGMINTISSTVKGIYYAFPGKNNF